MTITELRAATGRALGFGDDFDGTPAAYSTLSLDSQIALTNAMKAAIRANPAGYSAGAVAIAQTADISPPEAYSLGQKVADFFGEMEHQAQELNPLSTVNRKALFTILGIVAAVAAGAYFYAKGRK